MRNFKLNIALLSGLLLIFSSLAFAKVEGDTITLGSAISLTGKYSTNGLHTQRGYDFPVERINSMGGVTVGGKKYKLAVKYYADDNTATTFSADNYYVDTTSEQGRVVLRSGKSWPTVSELRDANAYEIQYKAGYGSNNGDTAANVPRNITNAIKMLALHLYENRDLVTSMSVNTIPNTAGTLLQQYKVQRLNNILGG